VGYVDAFIAVAEDCTVSAAKVPAPRGTSRTVAQIQYDLLSGNPFTFTEEDVLFASWFERQAREGATEDEIARLRAHFFAKDQPCLRTSPLARTHGWGLVFDGKGRVALCAMESPEYERYLNSDEVKVMRAFRAKRA
jgi:hypothetical protein